MPVPNRSLRNQPSSANHRIDQGIAPAIAHGLPTPQPSISPSATPTPATRSKKHAAKKNVPQHPPAWRVLGTARCLAILLLMLWGSFAAALSWHRSASAAPPTSRPTATLPIPPRTALTNTPPNNTALNPALGNGTLEIEIEDLETGKPLAARIAIYDSKNKLRRLPGVVTEGNTFSAFYELILKFPEGEYRYEVEAGPEYRPMIGTFTIQTNNTARHKVQLERAVDLSAENWAVVEQGIFASADEANVLAAAVQADHAGARTGPFPERRGRRDFAVPANPSHTWFAWHPLQLGEARLALWDPSLEPFGDADQESAEDEAEEEIVWPTDLHSLIEWKQAHAQRRILLDSSLSRSLPLWVGLELIDGVTLLNSFDGADAERQPEQGYHLTRQEAASPQKRIERSLEAYRQLVNAGVVLPVTAMSRWTDDERPLGIHRTMTATEVDGVPVAPWDALTAGQTWISNGPLVRFTFNRQGAGSKFPIATGESLDLDLGMRVSSRTPLTKMEFYRNGQLERSITRAELAQDPKAIKFTFDSSGWMMAVAWAGDDQSPQVAITSPFVVEANGEVLIHQDAVTMMLEQFDELVADTQFVESLALDSPLIEQARKFWELKLEAAR